jgi:DNA-binding transcriptional LysR family regulator
MAIIRAEMETLEHVGDLRVFLAVARLGGFSAAARELALSPGAVSKQIARLERVFDAQLFERNTRHVALTPEGRKISVHAREALRHLEQAADVASTGRENLAGRIRLTAPVTFGRKVLARAVADYRRQNTRVEFELRLADELGDLVEHDFDLAIATSAPPDAQFAARRLTSSRRILVASPAYLERRGTPRVLAELKQHDCLVLTRAGTTENVWPLVHERRRARVNVTGSLVSDSGEILSEWCLAGLGVALRETWDIEDELAAGRLRRVFPAWEGEIAVLRAVRVRREPMPRRVSAFLAFLAERWGDDPPWNAVG